MIYINYFVIISISKQTIFNNTNIDKLNFRFIKTFQYLLLINLEFKYKTNKFDIIFNTLSRLTKIITTFSNQSKKMLDALYNNINNQSKFLIKNLLKVINVINITLIYHVILIKMFDNFK